MAVLVSLSALPGVGKRTIAAALAQRARALWLRVAAGKRAMRASVLAREWDRFPNAAPMLDTAAQPVAAAAATIAAHMENADG